MPGELRKHLPGFDESQIATLYGSIATAGTYPEGSPERTGTIQAYDEVMKVMLIAATVIGESLISFKNEASMN